MGRMKDLAIDLANHEICPYWQELEIEHPDGQLESCEFCIKAQDKCACCGTAKQCMYNTSDYTPKQYANANWLPDEVRQEIIGK